MEKRVTAHMLRFLLNNRFKSKAEMARQLDIQQRTIEKVFEKLDVAKVGTLAFEKAASYCAKHHISLDSILEDFVQGDEGGADTVSGDSQAYYRLLLTKPEYLTAEGEAIFASMLSFLRQASAHVCPNCRTWCNPWDGRCMAENKDCYIGHMAREIRRDVEEFYTQEGASA